MSEEKKNEVTEEVKEEARELSEEELEKVSGGVVLSGGMDIGACAGISSGRYSQVLNEIAELEKLGLVESGGALALSGEGASQLLNEGRVGIGPGSESGSNTLNRPPAPPSPVADSVKKAVDAALQRGKFRWHPFGKAILANDHQAFSNKTHHAISYDGAWFLIILRECHERFSRKLRNRIS